MLEYFLFFKINLNINKEIYYNSRNIHVQKTKPTMQLPIKLPSIKNENSIHYLKCTSHNKNQLRSLMENTPK